MKSKKWKAYLGHINSLINSKISIGSIMAVSNFFSIPCIRHDHLVIVGIVTISHQSNTAQDVINAGYCNELTFIVTSNVWNTIIVDRVFFHNIHNSKESFLIVLSMDKVAMHLSYKPALTITSSTRLVSYIFMYLFFCNTFYSGQIQTLQNYLLWLSDGF